MDGHGDPHHRRHPQTPAPTDSRYPQFEEQDLELEQGASQLQTEDLPETTLGSPVGHTMGSHGHPETPRDIQHSECPSLSRPSSAAAPDESRREDSSTDTAVLPAATRGRIRQSLLYSARPRRSRRPTSDKLPYRSRRRASSSPEYLRKHKQACTQRFKGVLKTTPSTDMIHTRELSYDSVSPELKLLRVEEFSGSVTALGGCDKSQSRSILTQRTPSEIPVEHLYSHPSRKDDYSLVQCAVLYGLEPGLQRRFEHHGAYEMFQELKFIFAKNARIERYETSDKFYACKMEENASVNYFENISYYVSKEIFEHQCLNYSSKQSLQPWSQAPLFSPWWQQAYPL
ncbi:hypothetical protein ZWY2020_032426, partial [Hordeum vulgare]